MKVQPAGMTAEDVMTHNVVIVGPATPIADAIVRMISHGVSGMPVVDDDGRMVGIVTEGDFLRRPEIRTDTPPRRRWLELLLGPGSPAEDYVRSHGRRVLDVMTRNVVAVARETPVDEVVGLMEDNLIKRVPVVEDGRIVGIVSRTDLMSALLEPLRKAPKAPASDQSIRRRIVDEMRKQSWCPSYALEVKVQDGVVDLKGTIFDERQRRALHVLVENVDGVRGLRDHVTWVEPMRGADVDSPKIPPRRGSTDQR